MTATDRDYTLLYVAQRGPWAGHWRPVPFQRHADRDALRSRLTARGYYVRELSTPEQRSQP